MPTDKPYPDDFDHDDYDRWQFEILNDRLLREEYMTTSLTKGEDPCVTKSSPSPF